MGEMIKEFKKGDLLYIGDNKKAYWGLPQGYPYKEQSETVFFDWDGNIGDKENIDISNIAGREAYYVKVGDAIPQKEDFVGAAIQNSYGEVSTVSSEMLLDLTGGYAVGSESIVVVSNKDTFELYGVKLPSNGLWVFKTMNKSGVWNYYQSIIRTSETIHQMDPVFLPQATTITPGVVKQMPYLSDVTAAPTAEEFNALLKSLRDAGILATS